MGQNKSSEEVDISPNEDDGEDTQGSCFAFSTSDNEKVKMTENVDNESCSSPSPQSLLKHSLPVNIVEDINHTIPRVMEEHKMEDNIEDKRVNVDEVWIIDNHKKPSSCFLIATLDSIEYFVNCNRIVLISLYDENDISCIVKYYNVVVVKREETETNHNKLLLELNEYSIEYHQCIHDGVILIMNVGDYICNHLLPLEDNENCRSGVSILHSNEDEEKKIQISGTMIRQLYLTLIFNSFAETKEPLNGLSRLFHCMSHNNYTNQIRRFHSWDKNEKCTKRNSQKLISDIKTIPEYKDSSL